MSIWDDLERTANDLLHGKVGDAVSDVGNIVHHVVGGGGASGGSAPAGGGGYSISGVGTADLTAEELAARQRAAMAARAAQQAAGEAAANASGNCCDRYRFDSGFLVDGATGAVWKYDEQAKSFEEVPVHRLSSKQNLVATLVETRLSALRSQYEQEVLSTTPPASRAALLAAFEKDHLAPLREAALATQY